MRLPSATELGIRAPSWWETLLTLLITGAVLSALARVQAPTPAPRADALRYLDYSVNLLESGTFALSSPQPTAPGRANVPLYPGFLATGFTATHTTPTALRCYLATTTPTCPPVLGPAYGAQRALAALTILAIWRLGWHCLGTRSGAAWTAAAALISGQSQAFAGQLLTENLSMPLFALTTLALVRAGSGALGWSACAGVALGLLTLTRPEFLYLALAVAALALLRVPLAAGRTLRRRRLVAAAVLLTAGAMVVTPWLARNRTTFGDPALTVTYSGQVLAQRVQYNRMTTAELGAAFIYWLPDFGDSLALHWLPASSYRRLGFTTGSYYRAGLDYYDGLVQARGGTAAATAALVHDDVLSQPLKHVLVTLALAWRGLFVGKLWGLCGLLAFAVVLARGGAPRSMLVRVSAPAWFMLALYAAVSVCVPRYAVCLVPTFALALGHCANGLTWPRSRR